MIIKNLKSFGTLRHRPRAYKAKDAAYTTGGKNGYYLAAYPRHYAPTKQQKAFKVAAASCGIHKGITKSELQRAMVCVGDKLRGVKF